MDEKANKNGILLPESLVRMPFCIPALGICVDFQKCVDFWFRLKKCVDLRRFFSFVGLYQSWQGFFVDRDVLLPAHVRARQQQICHQVDNVAAGEVRTGFLAEGLRKPPHQILENIAAIHSANLIRPKIALLTAKFLDDEIQRVALHHALDDAVELELRQHILHICRKAIEIIAEVALDILRIRKQTLESELAGIIKL